MRGDIFQAPAMCVHTPKQQYVYMDRSKPFDPFSCPVRCYDFFHLLKEGLRHTELNNLSQVT